MKMPLPVCFLITTSGSFTRKIHRKSGTQAKAELYRVPNEQNLHTRLYIDPDADKQNSPIGSSTTKIPLLVWKKDIRKVMHQCSDIKFCNRTAKPSGKFLGVAVNISANTESDGNRFGDTPLVRNYHLWKKKYLILGMKLLD